MAHTPACALECVWQQTSEQLSAPIGPPSVSSPRSFQSLSTSTSPSILNNTKDSGRECLSYQCLTYRVSPMRISPVGGHEEVGCAVSCGGPGVEWACDLVTITRHA
jgi:hypothetical protein